MKSCDVDNQSRALLLSDGLVAVTGWFSSTNFLIIPDYTVHLGDLDSPTQSSDRVGRILNIESLPRLSIMEITHLMGQTEIMSFAFS